MWQERGNCGLRITDCGLRNRKWLRRCLIVALTAIFAGTWSSHFRNPQSSTISGRNPHFHKIHVSVTNIEFDRRKQMVEIVIRVFTDDLENALNRGAKQAVKIDL